MDPRTDGERFGKLIDQLYACLNEGRKAPDALRDGCWKVCRDVPYEEVKANAERIMATATSETRFPPPSALRNTRAHVSAPPSAALERAERLSQRNWEELRRRDPIAHQIEWRLAVAFRRMGDVHDEEHAQWVAEYRRWNTLRYAPRAEQEEAVRKVLGQ